MTELDKIKMDQINWRHSIPLGNNIVTPGQLTEKQMVLKLNALQLPDNLTQKNILDIGAWDGFYSFKCEKRGAKRILAIDTWTHGDGRAGFDLAKQALNSKVEHKTMSVYDLSVDNEGLFDITLFLGVLYHLKHPVLALETIAKVTTELIILESYYKDFDLPEPTLPLVQFHAHGRHGHKVNYLEPNIAFIKEVLKSAGFIPIEETIYTQSRVVIHAAKNERIIYSLQ
jgi:tRNA (mo5U34)-methyltransferase